MTCSICQQNEATMHFKQVSDGAAREMHLCAKCALQADLSIEPIISLTESLLAPEFQKENFPRTEKQCAKCEMKESDFQRLSRLGCPACYTSFAKTITPMISNMHKASRHTGRVPAAETVNRKIIGLERSMKKAVAIQDFEEAATLRDKISELKSDN